MRKSRYQLTNFMARGLPWNAYAFLAGQKFQILIESKCSCSVNKNPTLDHFQGGFIQCTSSCTIFQDPFQYIYSCGCTCFEFRSAYRPPDWGFRELFQSGGECLCNALQIYLPRVLSSDLNQLKHRHKVNYQRKNADIEEYTKENGIFVCSSINVKVKLSLCLTKHHAMKAHWGSGGIAPRILWPRH